MPWWRSCVKPASRPRSIRRATPTGGSPVCTIPRAILLIVGARVRSGTVEIVPTNGGSFEDIREILRETAAIQRQQGKILRQHFGSPINREKRMEEHDARMAEHDERMDRVGRHLEVLAAVRDDLIRGKADRKRR
jgi:hypothetical protein